MWILIAFVLRNAVQTAPISWLWRGGATKMSREKSIKNLEKADAYILITFGHDGMHVDSLIGKLGFTMLGGVELVKMDILAAFKSEAEKQLTP